MLILSNGLSKCADEGFLNVANNLVKRLKENASDLYVVSYERQSEQSDCYLKLNKLLLNRKLFSLIRSHRGRILYIPFPAKPIASALRIFILSMLAGRKIRVIAVMKSEMSLPTKLLLKMSNSHIIVFSKEAADFYEEFLTGRRVTYLKTGVDTERFTPVSSEKVKELKIKYGFDPERSVILHVGHLKSGRNVGALLKIDPKHQVLLVASTLTKDEQDASLKAQLSKAPNVRVIDEYVPHIEELYQLADLYFFPTLESGNCIDVPLSCLEAASCNKPIVSTAYGEMRELLGKPHFHLITDFEKDALNHLIERAMCAEDCNSRSVVMEYDWCNAVRRLLVE